MTKLEARAAAIVATNCAKYKAAGMTHRVELNVFTVRGVYDRTVVFYTPSKPDAAAIGRLAVRGGTKSISHSFESAKVSEL
jgi:hypothetical protein